MTLVEHEDGEPEGVDEGAPGQAPETLEEEAGPRTPPERRRVVAVSLVTNVAAATTALVGAAITGSTALLAAGLLTVADGGSQAGLVAGRWRDRRLHARSAAHHPLDTRRHRLFWLFAPGVVLVTVAGVVALSLGAGQLARSSGSPDLEIAVWFAAGALALKSLSLAVAVFAVRHAVPPGTHLAAYLLRASQPEPAVIVRQDTQAATAMVVAGGTIVAAWVTDTPTVDAAGAMAVGALLIIGAVLHVVQMKTMLLASPAGGHERQSITAAVEIEPTVVRLAHLEAYHLGPEELLVAAKVELIADLHASELADTVKRLAASIRRAVPSASVVYVEPDAPSSTAADDAGPLPRSGIFGSGGTYALSDTKSSAEPESSDVEPGSSAAETTETAETTTTE